MSKGTPSRPRVRHPRSQHDPRRPGLQPAPARSRTDRRRRRPSPFELSLRSCRSPGGPSLHRVRRSRNPRSRRRPDSLAPATARPKLLSSTAVGSACVRRTPPVAPDMRYAPPVNTYLSGSGSASWRPGAPTRRSRRPSPFRSATAAAFNPNDGYATLPVRPRPTAAYWCPRKTHTRGRRTTRRRSTPSPPRGPAPRRR